MVACIYSENDSAAIQLSHQFWQHLVPFSNWHIGSRVVGPFFKNSSKCILYFCSNFRSKGQSELYKRKCLRFNFQSFGLTQDPAQKVNITMNAHSHCEYNAVNHILTCLCISSTCLWGMLFKIVYISGNFSSGMTTDALQVHTHKLHLFHSLDFLVTKSILPCMNVKNT